VCVAFSRFLLFLRRASCVCTTILDEDAKRSAGLVIMIMIIQSKLLSLSISLPIELIGP